jgi:SAM-dependent methyltransferase
MHTMTWRDTVRRLTQVIDSVSFGSIDGRGRDKSITRSTTTVLRKSIPQGDNVLSSRATSAKATDTQSPPVSLKSRRIVRRISGPIGQHEKAASVRCEGGTDRGSSVTSEQMTLSEQITGESMVLNTTCCKVCGTLTELQGCVDAGRSCEIYRRTYLQLSGMPIYYHRCLGCGFLFTVAFDTWSFADFREKIYNDGYAAADPDYADGSRARANAALTDNVMGQLNARRVLDYGGGDGTMATELRAKGLDAHSWDPLTDRIRGDAVAPGTFDLVTAFEVFEHTPTPIPTAAEALNFLRPHGRLLFSTLLVDDLPRQATDFWYIAPRNGHISLHTSASLRALFARLGWTVRSFSANLHVAEHP